MMSTRPKTDASAKRTIWTFIVVVVLIIGGAYVYYEVPPAQHEEQPLATTIVLGDYVEPYSITDGVLVSSQPAGLQGELWTQVHFTTFRPQGSFEYFGPVLVARVIHDSGAVMTCRMGRSYLHTIDPTTYRLGCDRTVDVGELHEWSVAEVTTYVHPNSEKG